MITQERLKELLDYDKITGIFTWKATRRAKREGGIAGSDQKNHDGKIYRNITIDYKKYSAHALAWLYVYNEYPDMLDHKDTNSLNNTISNLRKCTFSQNNSNHTVRKTNKLGVKGVTKCRNKYRATITKDNKRIHLGCFNTIEEAADAYRLASVKYHGEFGRQ